MRRLTVVSGQRGGAPLLSFATKSPRRRNTPSTLPLPLPMAGPLQCQSKGVAGIDVAGPVGTGQMKHPQRECSCLDRGN